MPINIKFDSQHNIIQPKITLARRSGRRIANLPAYNISLSNKFNSYAELSFDVNKFDNGVEYSHWQDIKSLRLVWVRDWNIYFEIEVTVDESDETIKHITGKSLGESELSQINLYEIEINTEDDIARDDYSPTTFYNENDAGASLIDRIMSKAPHYSIGHVDTSLWNIQRTFQFDDKSIYDAMSEISEEVGCIFVIDSGMSGNAPARVVNAYDLEPHCISCGKRGPFYTTDGNGNITVEISNPVYAKNLVCEGCGSDLISLGYGDNTPVFISVENLAEDIQFETDVDSIKNCFKLEAGDDMMTAAIRSINPNGSSYIWYISDETKDDMSSELVARLDEYDDTYEYYMNDYVIGIDSSLIEQYNELVGKYQEYNEDLVTIDTSATGFSNLVQAYYDNVDFEAFLEDSFMPAPVTEDTGSAVQAAKLTSDTISIAAVANLATCSVYTATSSVLAVARTLVDAGYTLKAATSQYTSGVWTGTITVTNNSDEDDVTITGAITTAITDDYTTYTSQSINKQLNNRSTEYVDILTLFSYSGTQFDDELKKYGVASLELFHDCCQACLDILIKQGTSSVGTFYSDYYTKLGQIDAELIVRNEEVALIREVQTAIQEEFNSVRESLSFEDYLGSELWSEFVAYRREDTYSNSNFISDGLSNTELISNALEFMDVAKKDIYKSATMQHSITANIQNLLAMEEFLPIIDYFQEGNWIHVKSDGSVYRLRLLEYDVSFEDNNLDVEFSDITKSFDPVSDMQSVMNQMSSISSSYNSVAKQAASGDKGNTILTNWVKNGLDTTSAKIINSSDNQSQTWDSHGMLFKHTDPMSGEDTGEQLKIVNSTIAITDDNWESVKTAIGKFYYIDPVTGDTTQAYGINGEVLVGNLILGEELGIYSSDQNMTFNENGLTITNGTNTVVINPNDLENMFAVLNGDEMVLYTDASGNTVYKGKVVVSNNDIDVVVDPTADHIFSISNATDEVIYVDGDGNAHFDGSINSTSAMIGDSTQYISYEDGELTIKANSVDIETDGGFSSVVTDDGVISSINQSSEGVQISGDKVYLNGGTVVINAASLAIAGTDVADAISDAEKTATNYLYYSQSKGLVISESALDDDEAVDSTTSYNSRITGSGFDVYKNGSTRVAHFGEETIIGVDGGTRQIIDDTSLRLIDSDGDTKFVVDNDVSGVGYFEETYISLSEEFEYLNEDGTLNTNTLASLISDLVDRRRITSSSYDYVGNATFENVTVTLEIFGYAIYDGDSTDYYTLSERIGGGISVVDGVLTVTIGESAAEDWVETAEEFAALFPADSINHVIYANITMTYPIIDVQLTIGSRNSESTIGARSVSIGSDNVSSGTGSVAIGRGLIVNDDYSVVVGENNLEIEDASDGSHMPTAFAVGANLSTPFFVLKSGVIGMSSVNAGVSAQQTYAAGSATDVDIIFPERYPSTPFIFLTLNEDNVNVASDYGRIQIYLKIADNTGFTATVVNGGSASHTFTFSWFAISVM